MATEWKIAPDAKGQPMRARCISAVFYTLWGAILVTSVHDGVLVLVNRWTIAQDELNPLGRMLLHLAGGDVWLLLTVKTAGTIAAGTVLLLVYWLHPRMGWAACISLAIVQGMLLMFLTFT